MRDVAATWATGTSVESAEPARGGDRALTTNDVVHIAAHGTHNQDNPLFSSIRLACGPLFADGDLSQPAPFVCFGSTRVARAQLY